MASEPSESAIVAAEELVDALENVVFIPTDERRAVDHDVATALDAFAAEAVREERERCAKIAIAYRASTQDPRLMADAIASAIRGQDDE